MGLCNFAEMISGPADPDSKVGTGVPGLEASSAVPTIDDTQG